MGLIFCKAKPLCAVTQVASFVAKPGSVTGCFPELSQAFIIGCSKMSVYVDMLSVVKRGCGSVVIGSVMEVERSTAPILPWTFERCYITRLKGSMLKRKGFIATDSITLYLT